MRHFATYWLPPLLWASMILAASSDLFSASHTGGWIAQLSSRFGHVFAPHTLELLNHVLRKIGHGTAYGILSALSFRALRGEQTRWTLRWAIGAVALAVLVASIDEFHQLFIPSRTGTWQDVLLDTGGAAVMQIIIRVLLFRAS